MRFLWTYLILGIVFAFGFVWAAIVQTRHLGAGMDYRVNSTRPEGSSSRIQDLVVRVTGLSRTVRAPIPHTRRWPRGRALAPQRRMAITTAQETDQDTAVWAPHVPWSARWSPQTVGNAGGGEISGRIRHVGAEHMTLDDGTVLGLPWFLRVRTSELITVGTMLRNVKYENRHGEKVVAFIEVTARTPGTGSGP